MKNMLLNFKPIIENFNLVPSSIYDVVNNWHGEEKKEEFLVAEIDSEFADGIKLCAKYNIDSKIGVNCLVVMGIRGNTKTFAILLVPVGYKYDMSGVVKKR